MPTPARLLQQAHNVVAIVTNSVSVGELHFPHGTEYDPREGLKIWGFSASSPVIARNICRDRL